MVFVGGKPCLTSQINDVVQALQNAHIGCREWDNREWKSALIGHLRY